MTAVDREAQWGTKIAGMMREQRADLLERLDYLRGELRAERISTGELIELQGLAEHIDSGDVELLEAAGVPEFPETEPTKEELIDAVYAQEDVPLVVLTEAGRTYVESVKRIAEADQGVAVVNALIEAVVAVTGLPIEDSLRSRHLVYRAILGHDTVDDWRASQN